MLAARASPAVQHPLDTTGDDVHDDIRTEKKLIAAAAADLRHLAIQDRYAGGPPPDTAFGLASILDRLEIGWRDLPLELRADILAALTATGLGSPGGQGGRENSPRR